MREQQLRHKLQEEDMSATILSAFYDFDMLYKDKSLNINAIHLNSMLDKKAVGAPVSTSSTSSSCSYAPGFFRRNSISSADSLSNSNKFPANPYSNLKESSSASATAAMNKENKFRDRAYSETGERSQQLQVLQQKPGSQINSTRYKTELCRPFEESGACKYGEKCQFAHGYHELRSLSRHPKYKTEPCRTFHTIGFCPYGPRCHFIHNADERRPAPPANANVQGDPKSARELCAFAQRERPKLHHSLSFNGFSNHHGLEAALLENPTSRTPPPASSSSSSSSSCCSSSSCSNSSCSPGFYEEVLSPGSVSCVNGAFSFPGQELKSLLAPLAVHTHGGYCGNLQNGAYYGNLQNAGHVCPPSPPYPAAHLQALRRLSESPVFDSPPSPPDSLSDRDSYASGSLSSSGSLSGSESPSLDAGRRLPIFSRLSISDE
ncbi:mRNA decay activator protein ZFP36L2-A-like isoform X2 [Scleropages formosus]|uniref:mRNA decay activator protein ZFP36L2-A-like isoform X2 n=1 Tax=Scleropages formosus TaxID=113540 RepID=UPI0010FAA259|nr:mRNA decay activator protein ZFP36L2 isoform X2 [Scleropages formosus]